MWDILTQQDYNVENDEKPKKSDKMVWIRETSF
jgi:hypothetical protein